jgi:aspartate kinase
VSATGRTTDRILRRVVSIAGSTETTELRREVDRALATGEDLSAALLAVALQAVGIRARSLRGAEAGIRTEGTFGDGRIQTVDPAVLEGLLERGIVPVVSGFQGADVDGETTTLGRGGSDTTAVALAAALGSVPCHIVTDVTAVHDRDPRRHADARAFPVLDHDQLVALAESGATVMHAPAARLARDHGVPLRIYHFRSSLTGREGTLVAGATPAARRVG